jgi:hypothetical protein
MEIIRVCNSRNRDMKPLVDDCAQCAHVCQTRLIPYAPYREPKKQGIKFDEKKLRYDLISFAALDDMVNVLTFGATKYNDRNWETGILYSRLLGATLRHIKDWALGQKVDKETGINHLAHAMCCLMFLLHYENYPKKYQDFNDIPKHE